MNVSLQYLQQCAAQTGFQPQSLEKVIRLGTLAGAIAAHPLLGKALALKGGTALNLCLGEAPTRLSVDLDYNYVAHPDREAMQAARPEVEEAAETIARRLGFRLQRSADAFAGRKIYAIYASAMGPEDRVEIDLNFLWRQPLAGVVRAELWQPGELDRPQIAIVSRLELGIGKLLAFVDRSAPRDAWDVAQFRNTMGDTLLHPEFRACFIALSAMLPHPLSTYTRTVVASRLTPRLTQEQLVPMLSAGATPDPDQLFDTAWSVAEPLLDLTPQEREYVEAIHKGELRLDLLFPDDPAQATKLAGHPAILWKLRNVRQRVDRGGQLAD